MDHPQKNASRTTNYSESYATYRYNQSAKPIAIRRRVHCWCIYKMTNGYHRAIRMHIFVIYGCLLFNGSIIPLRLRQGGQRRPSIVRQRRLD